MYVSMMTLCKIILLLSSI